MKSRKCTLSLLIIYLIGLSWVILFKLQLSLEYLPYIRNINLIPFGQSVIINNSISYREIILNLLVFIPYGLLMHVLWEEKSVIKQFLPILGTTLLYETLQYIFAIGASDITDVIMNSAGGIAGILLAMGFANLMPKHWKTIINVFGLIGGVGTILLIGLLIIVNL